jgi:hypothetical protein
MGRSVARCSLEMRHRNKLASVSRIRTKTLNGKLNRRYFGELEFDSRAWSQFVFNTCLARS